MLSWLITDLRVRQENCNAPVPRFVWVGPPPTRRILGVQSLGRANRRVSAGFARFAVNINGAETALTAFPRPIRPEVSVGGFRDPFFGQLMVQFGQTG